MLRNGRNKTMEQSAGILAYKFVERKLKVLLAHPGGPFWSKKDNAAWSIPKGLVEEGENIVIAAKREFSEETGTTVSGELSELGSVKSGSKQITIFACEIEVDISQFSSNTFEMEWPPKSGKMQLFPENDKIEWFDIEKAKEKIFKGQIAFLDRLTEKLGYIEEKQPEQISMF